MKTTKWDYAVRIWAAFSLIIIICGILFGDSNVDVQKSVVVRSPPMEQEPFRIITRGFRNLLVIEYEDHHYLTHIFKGTFLHVVSCPGVHQ